MSGFYSILDEALEAWQLIREHLIEEVENLPEDQLDYRLTPATRSVREIVEHLLEVGEVMTGELCRPDTDFHRETWPEMAKRYATPASPCLPLFDPPEPGNPHSYWVGGVILKNT